MASSAGQRNLRIRFERQAVVSDGAGNGFGPWALLCGPFWVRLAPQVGREEVLQQRLQGVQPFEITVLANSGTRRVTSGDRAVNDRTGETYDIVDVRNPDERNVELAMLVKRGVADG